MNDYTLYWIRRDNHTDLLTEGYVGITNNVKNRWYQHNNKASKCKHLARALAKYDDIKMHVLAECTKEMAAMLEAKLRPNANIGWNMAPGGGMPDVVKGECPWVTGENNHNAKEWNIYYLKDTRRGRKYPETRPERCEEDTLVYSGWGYNGWCVDQGFDPRNFSRTDHTRLSKAATRTHFKGYYLVPKP